MKVNLVQPDLNSANDAFRYYYYRILEKGIDIGNTKAVFNEGFYLLNPLDNLIDVPWRKWSKQYADLEWQWYLKADPNPDMVAEKAKLWDTLRGPDGNVNSNYGYQWNRGNQLDYVIQLLRDEPTTRRAVISLYDGKENHLYEKDTVCTLAINFFIVAGRLNMNVFMRSCDLVYGFCNDQYCFSKLMALVAGEVDAGIGFYYHFCTNLHIYDKHFKMHLR